MLKTATLTWNSFPNYGTMLQAYALQQYLISLGCENQIIDDNSIVYATSKNTKKQNIWKYRLTRLRESLHSDYRSFYASQRKYCPKMASFKKKYLKVDYDIDNVLCDKADYDYYICGSDQIWSPQASGTAERTFFFAGFSKRKKISYAPSLGVSSLSKEYVLFVKKQLYSFQSLSIREEIGRKILMNLTDKEVQVVVDPTMLLSKTDWEKIIPKARAKERYVLGYILTYNESYLSAIRKYARRNKIKFYLFFLDKAFYGKADKLITGGPLDFLAYIKNAEIVFTDSFHGSIFSALLETPFYTLRRFQEDSIESQNSRIDTLMTIMDIKHLLLNEDTCIDIKDPLIDFQRIKTSLKPHIENSKQFLKNALHAADM